MIISNNPVIQLKKFIILFFVYMIFEGILRKWILPNIQIYIYFVKDFLLIFIYFYAIKNNLLFNNRYSKLFIFFIIIISLYGLIGYHLDFNDILSYFLGVRSYWLYAPLALIAVNVFDLDDLKKFFKINLYSIFPYFILVLWQGYSSYDSIINIGFNSLADRPERPTAYFTYITQNVFYLTFLGACLFSKISVTSNLTFKKFIYYSILIFVLLSIMILLKSRSVYLMIFAIIIYSFLTVLFVTKNNYFKLKKLIIIGVITPLLFLIAKISFNNAYEFSSVRHNSDSPKEMNLVIKHGGVELNSLSLGKDINNSITVYDLCEKHSSLCRIANELFVFATINDSSLYGSGIGAGTSAVSAFKKVDKSFPLGESENPRIIMELGYYVGTLFVLFKYFMSIFFHILFLFKNKNKTFVSPFLFFTTILLLLGPITYSASFISFIFWFSLSFLLISFKNPKVKKYYL